MQKMTMRPDLGNGLFIAGDHIGLVTNGADGLSRHDLAAEIARRWNAEEERRWGAEELRRHMAYKAGLDKPSDNLAHDAVAMTRGYQHLIIKIAEVVRSLVGDKRAELQDEDFQPSIQRLDETIRFITDAMDEACPPPATDESGHSAGAGAADPISGRQRYFKASNAQSTEDPTLGRMDWTESPSGLSAELYLNARRLGSVTYSDFRARLGEDRGRQAAHRVLQRICEAWNSGATAPGEYKSSLVAKLAGVTRA